ncbi:hypothetical protein IQ279_07345 [Streptomyces verrucosisporus]|uniref:hypothetical protein n=1 Tax=Streptomyces verrucosisporus TaxID=1695161 RepID=UPI0019D0E1BE|nr:hypothetical protein [Streptomyces verrucosisporus]MBN3929454.1 hypothetical protein [Streptomyces verrucosisporus]
MPGILSKIAMFARTPQGRRLTRQAKRAASDPRKRSQAKQALSRLRDRGPGRR